MDLLKRRGTQISIDGSGQVLDNIFVGQLWRNLKYEDIYLKCYNRQLHKRGHHLKLNEKIVLTMDPTILISDFY